PAEASAIAMEMQGVKAPRPMTHDLLKQILVGMGATLKRVNISAVRERTYYAELLVQREDHVYQFDARPSDSIALALRLQAPIFADATLLDHSSGESGESTSPPAMDAEQLRHHLEGMDPQDFGRFTP
ncbi:MAG TPA: bifunctional nuclease family protein, partial [Gemmatimonadales bacterium]|nr:bifunctional nuclease family protein [Gemmatimonadales bacterium]